jgi:hypothetical protein
LARIEKDGFRIGRTFLNDLIVVRKTFTEPVIP